MGRIVVGSGPIVRLGQRPFYVIEQIVNVFNAHA
jgi:hypothetical protein